MITKSTSTALTGAQRVSLFSLTVTVAALTALVDQATKAIAIMELAPRGRVPLLGDLFGLQLAFNPGTVMSLGADSTWVLTTVSAIACAALLIGATRARSKGWSTAIGFVLGGASGNLLDRFLAPPGGGNGHVIDFFAYGNLFIGNLADIFIGVGFGLGVLLYVRKHSTRRDRRVRVLPEPVSTAVREPR